MREKFDAWFLRHYGRRPEDGGWLLWEIRNEAAWAAWQGAKRD